MLKVNLKSLVYQSTEKLLGRKSAKTIYFHQKKQLLKDQQLLFIHVPRTGGTSVSKALYGGTIGHLHISEWENLMGVAQFAQYTSFSIIRNPYDRLLSAYHFLRNRRQLPKRIMKIAEHREAFVVFVKEWLTKQDLSKADFTLEPQHPYLGSYVNGHFQQQVGHLFLYEEMHKLEDFLKQQTGKPITLGHHNRINRKQSLDAIFDESIKSVVREMYKQDFELFGHRG